MDAKHYEVIVIVIAWGDRPRSGEGNPKEGSPEILSPEGGVIINTTNNIYHNQYCIFFGNINFN